MQEWIAELFANKDLTRMGHLQRAGDLNLGLGWIYYAMARTIRPRTVVVIGSYRGFVPMVFARALSDNREGGEVVFIDPSLVDDFWKDPALVQAHFSRYGIRNIRHFLMTTQEFTSSDAYRSLGPVGIVFIDGHHSEEQARFDHEAFDGLIAADGVALFHDTLGYRLSKMHGPERTYRHTVKDYVDRLRSNPGLDVFDLPYGDGVTLVRRLGPAPSTIAGTNE